LHWAPPSGNEPITEYVLYVDGRRALVIDGGSLKATLGAFDGDDSRTFALAAVDLAGNLGSRTALLSGVPNLVGLRLPEAFAALDARGLVLGGKRTLSTGGSTGLVVSQRPAAGLMLALANTPVFVVLSRPSSATGGRPVGGAASRLVIEVSGEQTVSCRESGRLALHTDLSRDASVVVRFLSPAGVPLDSVSFSRVPAGSRTIAVRLPSDLAQQRRYRMILTATAPGQIARTELRLQITGPRGTARQQTCGA
jgi:hypothetical protein